MNAQYQKAVQTLALTPSNSAAPAAPCATQRAEEHAWRYGTDQSVPADGRYACGPLNKIATITWTANADKILASAERTDLDLKTLGDWWLKNGGPYPPAG